MPRMIRDSSGKMALSDLCGTTSTGAKAWNASGNSHLLPYDHPAVLHVTHRGYESRLINYCMGKLCCNPKSEEWCALREPRVTDSDGHLPRCEQEDGARHTVVFIVGMPRRAPRAPVQLTVLSRHGSDSSSIGSPASFHASIPPTTSVAFRSPISCSDAAANELVYPS